jgi:hypothetical protein
MHPTTVVKPGEIQAIDFVLTYLHRVSDSVFYYVQSCILKI